MAVVDVRAVMSPLRETVLVRDVVSLHRRRESQIALNPSTAEYMRTTTFDCLEKDKLCMITAQFMRT